ncbi:hypothetical protein CRG98_014305 [Punica granatum]|uniref:Uncharacterized protein n=1 Tax=Punica granatum TaxID=22663 RepID=A0A2I0K9N6_PUNGR|nr:hypothetical protein CRG98_014305 [Punica granatum]
MTGRMLDHLRRVLGADGPIAVFTGDAVACECYRREAVLRPRYWGDHALICRRSDLLLELLPVGLWETGLAARAVVLLLEVDLATGAVVLDGGLVYPWGGGVFDLPEAGLATGVVAHCSAACSIVVRWGCPGLATRDSSSG